MTLKLKDDQIESIRKRFVELNKIEIQRNKSGYSIEDIKDYRDGFMHALMMVGLDVDSVRFLSKIESLSIPLPSEEQKKDEFFQRMNR